MNAPLRFDAKATGLDESRVRLMMFAVRAPSAFAGGVFMVGSNVISTAMKLTPVRTGWLRGSRYVTFPIVNGERFEFEIGFSASYAAFVHEIDRAYRVGEWKFLQTAVNWHAPTMLDDIARMTARLMASGHGLESVPVLHPTSPVHGPEQRPRGTFRSSLTHMSPRERRAAWSARRRQQRRESASYLRDVLRNQARIQRESAASLAAQRAGRRPPRPGRG